MRVNYNVNYKIYPYHNQQTVYEQFYLHNIIVRTVRVFVIENIRRFYCFFTNRNFSYK